MKVITSYDPKSVPFCKFDWEAVWSGWGIGDPVGYGASREEAIQDLLNKIEGYEHETIEVV